MPRYKTVGFRSALYFDRVCTICERQWASSKSAKRHGTDEGVHEPRPYLLWMPSGSPHPPFHNLQVNVEFTFIVHSALYRTGRCVWSHIYQSNLHNIKISFTELTLGLFLEAALPWPALAFWCSHMQTDPANALEPILSLSSSTGFNPPAPSSNKKKKRNWKCEGCRIQKWLSAIPMWAATVGAHLSHGWKRRTHTHTQTHGAAHVHTTSRWGRGNG